MLFRGPRFDSQHLCWMVQNCLLLLLQGHLTLLASTHGIHTTTQTHRYTHTTPHKHTLKNNDLLGFVILCMYAHCEENFYEENIPFISRCACPPSFKAPLPVFPHLGIRNISLSSSWCHTRATK